MLNACFAGQTGLYRLALSLSVVTLSDLIGLWWELHVQVSPLTSFPMAATEGDRTCH